MDAPERIWAWTGRDNARRWHSAPTSRDCDEYRRADLCADPTLLAEAVEVLRWYAADGWKDEPMDPPTPEEIALHGGNILDCPMPAILSDRGDRARAFLSKLENRHDR